LINEPTDGESRATEGTFVPDVGDDGDDGEPTEVGMVVAVGVRVSQLATSMTPADNAARRMRTGRIVLLRKPDY
jgi:hypothetical protein